MIQAGITPRAFFEWHRKRMDMEKDSKGEREQVDVSHQEGSGDS